MEQSKHKEKKEPQRGKHYEKNKRKKENRKSSKATNQQMQGQVPKEPAFKRLLAFHSMVVNYLGPMVGGNSPDEIMSRFQILKVQQPKKFDDTRALFRNMSKTMFGTWVPKIKFHGAAQIVASAAGVITASNRLRAADLDYFASFSGIFDEYRFAGPIEAIYRPGYTQNVGGQYQAWGVGVIDFVDGTALASTAGALMFDTAQIFPLTVPNSGPVDSRWKSKLMGIPDLTWYDTSVGTTDVAWFKVYAYFNTGGTVNWGYQEWVVEIEFRQLYGV